MAASDPFDTIATMMLRTGRSFDSASEEYFSNWDAVTTLQTRLRPEELLVVRHEPLIGDPRTQLSEVCSFLGVTCDDDYLNACAAILYHLPSRSRDSIDWMPEQRVLIEDRAAGIDELQAYSFDA